MEARRGLVPKFCWASFISSLPTAERWEASKNSHGCYVRLPLVISQRRPAFFAGFLYRGSAFSQVTAAGQHGRAAPGLGLGQQQLGPTGDAACGLRTEQGGGQRSAPRSTTAPRLLRARRFRLPGCGRTKERRGGEGKAPGGGAEPGWAGPGRAAPYRAQCPQRAGRRGPAAGMVRGRRRGPRAA